MALTRDERKLIHQKFKQPTLGIGKPDNSQGSEGDITYRKIEGSGTVQYLKQDGSWIAISSSGEMPKTRIITRTISSTSGSISSEDHSSLSGLLSDDHTQYTHNTIARTITADHNFTGTPVFASPDINGGSIDGAVIGSNNQAAGDFTAIGAVAAGTIVGTTIDATTDFTIDGLVITPDTISTDADLTLDVVGDIILDAAGGQVFIQSATSTDAVLQFKIGSDLKHMIGIDADDDDALRFHGPGPTQLATNCNMVLDGSGIQLGGGNITFNDNEINIDNDTSGRLNIYNASLGLHINTPVPFTSSSGMSHSDDTSSFDSFALRWKTLTGGTYNGQHIAGGELDYKNNYAMVGTFKESTRYADHSTSFVLQS